MAEGSPSSRSRSRRRDFLKYTGASVTATGLAGCMSIWGSSDPRPTGTPPGLDGDVEPDQFAGETFRLGVLGAAPDTPFGAGVHNAAQMAIDEINQGNWWLGEQIPEMEGVLGAELEFRYGNTNLQARQTEVQYNRLVRDVGCVATFGASNPRALLNPMAETQRLHLATIPADPLPNELVSQGVSPVGGNPQEEYEQYKYFFRPGPINTNALGRNFLEFLELYGDELGWERIAFLNENGVESDEFMQFVPQRVRDLGFEVPVAQVTSESTTNWTPIYDEVEAAGCDVALVVQLLSGVSSVNQWAAQQRPFAMGGIHIQGQLPTFWDDTAGACEGLFTMNAITPHTTNTELTQDFMANYADRFSDAVDGGVPFYAGPITYDAIRQLSQAIVQTGAHPVSQVDSLINHMEDPESFVFNHGTIIPTFAYRPPTDRFAHDPIWDCMTTCEGELTDDDPHGPTGVPVWQQWHAGSDGGRMEAMAPEVNKSADYIRPPWMR